MGWLNANVGIAQWLTLLATAVIGFLAFSIGSTQNEINRAIEKLQDSVEIFAYPFVNQQTSLLFLRLTNVGSVQLYMTGYSINDEPTLMPGHALIPASQQQNAWFDIQISPTTNSTDKRVVIDLIDSLGRNWESVVLMTHDNVGWVTSVTRIAKK